MPSICLVGNIILKHSAKTKNFEHTLNSVHCTLGKRLRNFEKIFANICFCVLTSEQGVKKPKKINRTGPIYAWIGGKNSKK